MNSNLTRQEVLERLTEIFRTVLDQPSLVLEEQHTARDVRGWDSLAHINIVLAVESSFGVRLRAAEVAKLQNISGLIEFIQSRLSK